MVLVSKLKARGPIIIALLIIAALMIFGASYFGTYWAEVEKPIYNMEGEQIGYVVDYEPRLTLWGNVLLIAGVILLLVSLSLSEGGKSEDQEP